MSNIGIDAAKVFARIARTLAEQPDDTSTMNCLVQNSQRLTGCSLAALWELNFFGTVHLGAATDVPLAERLGRIAAACVPEPVHEALSQRAPILVGDLDTTQDWSSYATGIRSEQLPIRSIAAYSLHAPDAALGVLALHSPEPGYFTEDLIDIGGVMADHATIALTALRATTSATHMRDALESNRRIGMAIGILMTQRQVTDAEAFELLRVASRHTRLRVRDLAEQVVSTGILIDWTPGPPHRPRRGGHGAH